MNKIIKLFLPLVLIALIINIAFVKCETTKITFSLEKIASIDTNGESIYVTAIGDTAFVLDTADYNPGGVVIIDITDPTNPVKLSSFYDGGVPHKIEVIGDYAFVADGSDGLEVLEISDLENPIKVDSYSVSYSASDFEIIDDILYLAAWSNGLVMLNISNPANIEYLGSYLPGSLNCIHVSIESDLMCATNHFNDYTSILLYDLSNPITPQLLSSIVDYEADFWDPVIYNEKLYTGNHGLGGGELRVYNVSNPSSASLISTYDKGGSIFSITFNGTTAFVSNYEKGTLILDISDPENILEIGRHDDGGNCKHVILHNDLVLSADRSDGLEILSYELTTKIVGLPVSISISIMVIIFSFLEVILKRQKQGVLNS